MSLDSVPQIVQQLLRDSITTFEELDIVLLLHANPKASWTVAEISARARLPEAAVLTAVRGLQAAGVLGLRSIEHVSQYFFAPQNRELAAAVDALADVYQQHRGEIMRLLSRYAIDRLRLSASRAFADAFLIRKKDDDG